MAGTLAVGVSVQYSNNDAKFDRVPANFSVVITGDAVASGTQSVTTGAANLEKGGISTSGYLLIHNLDATNFVEVGYDDTGFKPVVKIKGGAAGVGEWALFRSAQATLQVKADTATCLVEYYLFED